MELERKEISTKFDEANQTIGALRFENNFLVEKTKKFEAELFQVRVQLERTSSAKLDEMLSIQKSASDQIDLGYDFSSFSIAFASTIVFVPFSKNVETENTNVKTALASENSGLRRETLKSLNRKSSISVIIVKQPVILDLIVISG